MPIVVPDYRANSILFTGIPQELTMMITLNHDKFFATRLPHETHLGEGAVAPRVLAKLELHLLVAVVHLERSREGGPGVVSTTGRWRLRQDLERGDGLGALKQANNAPFFDRKLYDSTLNRKTFFRLRQ